MTQGLWSPVVFARTLHVDFRLLARPKGLRPEDLAWLQTHIAGITTCADDLRESRRFAIFKNERLCVFGMACMAGEISGEHIVVAGRDLYLFAGFATLLDASNFPLPPHHAAVPSLSRLDVRPFLLFRPLYDHVHRLWRDERTILTPDEQARELEFGYQPSADIRRMTYRVIESAPPVHFKLNYDRRLRRSHPGSAASKLWIEAAHSRRPVSLCCGVPDVASVADGPFWNLCLRSLAESSPATDIAAGYESPLPAVLDVTSAPPEEPAIAAASPSESPGILERVANTLGGLLHRGPETKPVSADALPAEQPQEEPPPDSEVAAKDIERWAGFKKVRNRDDPEAASAADHWIDY